MGKVLGIDDAGRGPVIGPLVMAGVLVDDEGKLKEIGVKDSKILTPRQREMLFERILKVAKHKTVIIPPEEVDKAVEGHNLNWLEADASIEIIKEFKPDTAILDCPSNNKRAFKEYIMKRVKGVDIRSEHKADAKYAVVSAASIIAKVTRDREIEKIKGKHGIEFGSGYPSDPRTAEFLRRNFRKVEYKGIIRRSWASVKELEKGEKQKRLGDF